MYRAIAWWALRRGVDPHDEGALGALAASVRTEVDGDAEGTRVRVDGEDATPHLRDPEVDAAVSLVSAVPAVREAMVREQRRIAADRPVVMVGRDIGTVVLPDADLKIYLDASVQRRAERRTAQRFPGQGDLPDVTAALTERDRIDSQRETSPLRPADDAIIVDTDTLTLHEVIDRIEALARERTPGTRHA